MPSPTFPNELAPPALKKLMDGLESKRIEAFNEGQRIRQQRGVAYALTLANALLRDGRNDSISIRAEVGAIYRQFPNTWENLAEGLRTEISNPRNSEC